MNRISDKISFLPAAEHPLSAEIGIIRDGGLTWLYDVGCGADRLPELDGGCNVVLSHFHQDHTGNLDRVAVRELFVSRETFAHTGRGTVISGSVTIGNLRIFPLPSSHAKGCLGLEVDGAYTFVGDALYCRSKNGCYSYKAQLLQEEIAVLKSMRSPFLLVSHHEGFVRRREEVIAELEEIYAMRSPNDSEIRVE